MATDNAQGTGTREDPWLLKTPERSVRAQMYRDESPDPPALVCLVGKTELRYQLCAPSTTCTPC